jgi:cation transport ATPase
LAHYNYDFEAFLFCRHGVDEKPFQEVEDLKNQSVVYVGVDNTLAGLIYFEDQIREDARQVVESLSSQGINVYMLSGDKKSTAEHVASLVGIPKEKVRSFSFLLFFKISGPKDGSLRHKLSGTTTK